MSYQLFLGADHLLYVSDAGFTETYKRFFLRDIQAVVMSQSTRRRNTNLVLAGLLLAAVLITLGVAGAVNNSTVALGLLSGVGLLFGIAFGVNMALGPTCNCVIKTAVQTELIAPLVRMRRATRVVEELRVLINSAQGELVTPPGGASATVPAPIVRAVPPLVTAPPVAVARHEPGLWHLALFSVLLIDAGIAALDAMMTSVLPTLISTGMTIVHIALLMGVMIKQRDSDIRPPLRSMVWWDLGSTLVLFGLGYTHMVVSSFQNAGQQSGQWEMIVALAQSSPWDSPLLTCIYLFSIISGVILGALGLVLTWRHRRTHAGEVPPGPPRSATLN